MGTLAERLIIKLDKIEFASKDCDHNCIKDSEYCGGLDKCKYTMVSIDFCWKYDTNIIIQLNFNLNIPILLALSKETLYLEKTIYENSICIDNPETYTDSLFISQYETNNGLQTVIEMGVGRLKIYDKDMEISKHILKRFKEIYEEYLEKKKLVI